MSREPRVSGLRRVFRLSDRHIERDVDDEIAFHLDSRIRALVDAGMAPSDARRVAETEFGDLCASRRELAAVDRHRRRRERTALWLDTNVQDLRHAVRALRRAPSYTIAAVVTLVIGIAAAVTIFAVVDAVLVRSLPYENPDRLIGAWHDMPAVSLTHEPQAAITFFTYRSQARTIEQIGVYLERAVNVADAHATTPPQRITYTGFSAGMWPVLGVHPLRGRVFTDDDDRPGAAPVMVISEGMWRSRFGGAADVVGRRLDVNGVSREIIGVMPKAFRFPSAQTELWMPLALDPRRPPADAYNYPAVARLKPGITIAEAQRDFAAVLPRVIDLFPTFVPGLTTRQMMDQIKPIPVLTPLREDVAGGIAGTLWMIAGAAALLLIVAYVNVATLSLVRFDARQRELAVREALGAGRSRIMRYYFCESVALSAAGGLVGTIVAWAAVRALVATGPTSIPRLTEIAIDTRVLVFAAALVLLGAAACSAIPLIRIAVERTALREAARGATAGRRQHRVRATLVTAQIALALVVLAGSGLLVRSFQRLHAVHPGFTPDHVATMWVSLPRPRYARDSDAVRFYTTLIERTTRLPGVIAVGATSRLPLVARGINQNPIYPEDASTFATTLPPLELLTTVGGDYFRTIGLPLIAGRPFDPAATQREGDVIVSSRTAALFWHDSSGVTAIGKRFRALPTGPLYTIIGVVGNAQDTSLAFPSSPTVYFPELVQHDSVTKQTARTMALAIRTSADPSSVISDARRIVHNLDPTLPVFDVREMTDALRSATAQLEFTIVVVGSAAIVTLLLGAIGLYGVLAYIVTLRRRELGIRIALGASPRSVAADTTRHAMALTAAGVLGGLVAFTGTTRFVRRFLFGVAPWDPFTIVMAACVLLAMAALASWIPARRASRVDPAEALRAE